MTEREYVCVTNLTKLRLALLILGETLWTEDQAKAKHHSACGMLRELVVSLEDEILKNHFKQS